MNRKQLVTILLIAFFVVAIGSMFFNRLAFPYLSTIPGFSWVGKLQSNAPIVISRREEVRLNEGVNLIELTKQAQTVVVSIYHPTTRQFLGNGLVITSDGIIFTTKEIVGTNGQASVQMNDGAVFSGLVRAQDPKSPLAVVTIDGRNLPVAQFSDAGNMQTAQRVFALGRTNIEFTREFASGLVTKTLSNSFESGKVLSTEVFENTINTDAHLSADFVGGPIVNLQGLIVGMIVGTEGQILFSEAIDGAISTYLSANKIQRPFIGLNYVMITKNDARLRGLDRGGAQVTAVESGSPAALSGLVANDMILQVSGQDVDSSSLEQLLISQGGNQMRLLIRRGTEQRELTLTPILK